MDVNEGARKFKRVPINIRCGIIFQGMFHFVDALSISEGGLMIRAPVELRVGDSLEVQLSIDSKTICPLSDVIYILPRKTTSGEDLIGLKFSKIDFADLRVIRSYVRHA